MTHDVVHETLTAEAKEIIVSYVMGLLEPEDRLQFEQHLSAGCRTCRTELNALNQVAGWLSLAAPQTAPPPSLRERIREIPRREERPRHIIRSEEGKWVQLNSGIAIKRLYVDQPGETQTLLIRMDPGAKLPPHNHVGPEQCLVLQGEVWDDGQLFRTGDYVVSREGSHHSEVRSDDGCLLLIVNSIHDRA
jgi:quercetin dioxygenase-like cupin family protein